ncbi:MAG: hypothetical protein DLM67_24630 [Candidatus Nephthysia bennettiae]|uniref:DUF4190 domain-containing protein n=2 Tax=Candidatus Nephthysia bennettiae TaxID=3127016 RepID=A0A934K734_9BACT|nr:DUF4190 domain-containing protein [Candidatus Dormibacteraeota bacterium]MBJ7611830.1 DUF4190 domain-containing protein [Candidatus Dormibacteraeota bacterium]PZR86021.1 MAG: hypothetical protein DLM67_24630 [Candidatus Dormibacteraeota bacterium]
MAQYRPDDPPTTVPPPLPGQVGSLPIQRSVNSLAIVSLVAGIAGYIIPHPFIAGLIAIVTGHMARRQIRQTGESGSGLAMAGLILGYLHLVLSILLVGFIILVVMGVGAYVVSQGSRAG